MYFFKKTYILNVLRNLFISVAFCKFDTVKGKKFTVRKSAIKSNRTSEFINRQTSGKKHVHFEWI